MNAFCAISTFFKAFSPILTGLFHLGKAFSRKIEAQTLPSTDSLFYQFS